MKKTCWNCEYHYLTSDTDVNGKCEINPNAKCSGEVGCACWQLREEWDDRWEQIKLDAQEDAPSDYEDDTY
jgi:hypothetical protein